MWNYRLRNRRDGDIQIWLQKMLVSLAQTTTVTNSHSNLRRRTWTFSNLEGNVWTSEIPQFQSDRHVKRIPGKNGMSILGLNLSPNVRMSVHSRRMNEWMKKLKFEKENGKGRVCCQRGLLSSISLTSAAHSNDDDGHYSWLNAFIRSLLMMNFLLYRRHTGWCE